MTSAEDDTMSWTIVVVALAILVLILLLIRRKKPAPSKRPTVARSTKPDATSEFHAVSIKFASSACAAAKALEGKRFLSTAAPRLPLPDCDVPECKCRFRHHRDRRSREDRRNPYRAGFAGDTGRYQQDQRSGQDRRKNSDPL
jgi:hypothetical protein